MDKIVTAATNKHATIEELLDASFSVRSGSYQRKAGDEFYRKILDLLFVFLCFFISIIAPAYFIIRLWVVNKYHK
jgi:hypothetical protein